MAKLSARGRTEIYRIFKPLSQEDAFNGNKATKKVLMSDRHVLVNFGWGWKQAGKLGPELQPEEWLTRKLSAGWKLDQ